ncbi:hypothetical protein [Candidatus Nitrosocosmicus arcticus]|uniref:Uncharacterized protein n=1 Tax=Candidatus Nitrosocosmicus arcticus TaxID=2035267 RepID=A0A557SZM5_9ARCH|nr:hypothetical protein [Candidatus Nitrosocosmicus arcticus]TVP42046.1 hypothetical protein NARC_10453 [Candidatus Nitrosocosmicus arcticus]
MKINPPLDRVAFVSVSFIIPLSFILAFSSLLLTPEIYIHGQETNSSINDEFLLSINQTYLSLIPLMIEEVQNTNASDIPIQQIMEATPSNATALQDIVKNNSNKTAQNEASATLNNATVNNSNPPRPQDLIPVVVNMTQNTNASDIPIKNVINTVPSNATALQDIVKNNSNKTAQNEASATLNNATVNNSNPPRPQDLIPVVVNMTQNTNASDIPIKNVINTVPSNATALQDIVKNNSNKTAQNEASATLNNATVNNSNPPRPQDLIPVVVNMTQNTNASDIPIKNVINTVPSNATALQDIVKNNSNKTAQNEASATLNNATVNNSNPPRPQDLIPVVVNMTQNTNASDIPIKNVINTVPSNATALQDIVKNNSNKTAQNEASATLNNATVNNSNPPRPQDLIPVVVNMTQNTNASDLGFMRIINALPGYDNSESSNANLSK